MILLSMFAASVCVAQNPTIPPQKSENYIPPVGVPTDYNEEKPKQDTVAKKVRERKPLESVYFDDSTRVRRIFVWSVNPQYNDIRLRSVDTLLQGTFQQDYNFMQIDGGIGSAYLGNVGSASVPLNYFSRETPQEFSFVNVWNPFILRPSDVIFYNAKMPYSRLTYSMSGEVRAEENQFHIVLSHNVSPSTSANIVYNAESTKGLYMKQGTMDRYFATSLAHTGKRYAIHGGYIYNHGNINENGGIKNDSEIRDTVMPPNQVAVWLDDSNNTYRGHTFWFTQSYGIPLRKQRDEELTIQKIPTIYIGQQFEYSLFKKNYKATRDTVLYPDIYIDKHRTNDSIAQEMIDVKAFMQLQPYNREGILGLISAGIGNRSSQYYYYVPDFQQSRWGDGGSQNRNTTYLYGSINGKFKKYLDWGASVNYNLLGYKSGDFSGEARIRLSAYTKKTQQPISLDARLKLSLTEPDFWVQSYFSNHFAWQNSFTKESSMLASVKFSVPSIGLYLGGDYALTSGKVYFDSKSRPAQATDPLSVLGVFLQKDFRAGGFHFNHRVLFQLSSSQIVAPTPLVSAYASYYFGFDVVKNVLNVQVGVDGRYQTKYYAFAYNAAISQFYNQREQELGGYPYLDAFVSAKWKRMRILVKLQHFNHNLFGGRDYFMILHQPQNPMMFKLKFSWSFYD